MHKLCWRTSEQHCNLGSASMTPLVSTMLPGLESGNFEKTEKKIPGHVTQALGHSIPWSQPQFSCNYQNNNVFYCINIVDWKSFHWSWIVKIFVSLDSPVVVLFMTNSPDLQGMSDSVLQEILQDLLVQVWISVNVSKVMANSDLCCWCSDLQHPCRWIISFSYGWNTINCLLTMMDNHPQPHSFSLLEMRINILI